MDGVGFGFVLAAHHLVKENFLDVQWFSEACEVVGTQSKQNLLPLILVEAENAHLVVVVVVVVGDGSSDGCGDGGGGGGGGNVVEITSDTPT